MIFILACFDLAVVVVIHPLIIFETTFRWLSVGVIKDWVRYIYILFDFSFHAFLTMTLERYLALVYPFFHKRDGEKIKIDDCFRAISVTVLHIMDAAWKI